MMFVGEDPKIISFKPGDDEEKEEDGKKKKGLFPFGNKQQEKKEEEEDGVLYIDEGHLFNLMSKQGHENIKKKEEEEREERLQKRREVMEEKEIELERKREQEKVGSSSFFTPRAINLAASKVRDFYDLRWLFGGN